MEPSELLSQLETIVRVSTKAKVAEAKLRMAAEAVAEKICSMVGEPTELPADFAILNVDPESSFVGTPRRPRYLILVHCRRVGGRVLMHALSSVPIDALESFDYPPAGRLTLTIFANVIQNGWLFEVARIVDQRADHAAALLRPIELAGKALS
jgi:hypothetical protein